MSLRKAIFRLVAVGFTSTVLLSLSGVAADAATFNLSYRFRNGTAFSALLDGELRDDQNVVDVETLKSATLTDSSGALLDFAPDELAFDSKLTLDGGFAMLGIGDQQTPDAVSFRLFNNATVNHRKFSFVNLVYQSSQGKVRLTEAFSYNAFALQKADIPENSSAAVMLTALAGAGLAIAKKHRNRQEA